MLLKELIVEPANDNPTRGVLKAGDRIFPCALGKEGLVVDKQEGDHKTPVGQFPLRTVFYRFDKLSKPIYSQVPMLAILEEDGWCDDPQDAAYNQPVMLPYHARAERLWREDDLYDVLVVLGQNDDPVEPGKGSAIFLHVARGNDPDNFEGTEGCVALQKEHLLELLPDLSPETTLTVIAS